MSGGAGGEAGNYKGVMLCNRPTDTAAGQGPAHLTPSIDAPSFRPVGLPAEPLGLNPAKENLVSNVLAVHEEAERRRAENPNAVATNFMNKHRAWLSEMARKKAVLNSELRASAEAAEAKRTKFVAYSKSLRAAVRERAAQMDKLGLEYTAPKKPRTPPPLIPPPRERQTGASSPPEQPPPAEAPKPPTPPKPKAAASASKPAWAMTEDEAEDAEGLEADELLKFASNLDYDAYIDDLEVRQALTVIRERIDLQNAMAAAAAATEEANEGSIDDNWRTKFLAEWNGEPNEGSRAEGSRAGDPPRRAKAEGAAADNPDWDASTNAGDDRREKASEKSRAMAEELLASNPNLAAKHSVRSLTAVVDKQKTHALGAGEEDLPPLRVVTIIENPRKVEATVDASNLPYLHRNPAI